MNILFIVGKKVLVQMVTLKKEFQNYGHLVQKYSVSKTLSLSSSIVFANVHIIYLHLRRVFCFISDMVNAQKFKLYKSSRSVQLSNH